VRTSLLVEILWGGLLFLLATPIVIAHQVCQLRPTA
jgi:hypothetical protein